MSPLTAWSNFYVIIGTAAATLTGLMFVAITLIASVRGRGSGGEVATFGTPTIVHFALALLVSATLSAPWPALAHAAVALGLIGLGGMAYAAIVLRRARRVGGYRPVLEDWLWHTVFPLVAYAALAVAALLLPRSPTLALFIIASATLLLLYIGIHNAWDTVTYVAIQLLPRQDDSQGDRKD